MKLVEIAKRIHAHLRRMENDPEVNTIIEGTTLRRFYNANAGRAGSYVGVTFVSYQEGRNLSKPDAEAYLAWLDAGNDGDYAEFRIATEPRMRRHA